MNRKARLYFSFRSPYSWMAVEKLARALPGAYEQLEFVPYWDPDQRTEEDLRARDAEFHYVPMSKAKHLYVLIDTKRMAERLGLPIHWPIDRDPWWEVPHLAWLAARRRGRPHSFYRAVVTARWIRGENICDPEVIRGLAVQTGLDGDELVGAVHAADLRAEGADCLARAYDDDIFGVPYLRLGRQRFWGLDRVDQFIEAYATTDLGRKAMR
ncbi:2-hydroxychromene-2-carboxylate isomerase [Nocardia sp. NPDC051321]|uniref:2-hydroxychromene-2-carboxylate isomerase n=1 Tax=Nocardia sp. NPDC051321 TaxID=3364323 RepID=UPI0037BAFDBB